MKSRSASFDISLKFSFFMLGANLKVTQNRWFHATIRLALL